MLPLAAFLFASCGAGDALAEAKARLVYVRGDGADECPEELDLRLWVIARLGYDPFSPQASRVVLARVEQQLEALHGSVELVDRDGKATGRRELSSPLGRCQELARALALSISLAVDPERASAPPKGVEEPPPREPAEPPPPQETAPRAIDAVGPRPLHWFTSASLVGGVAILPAAALGGAVGVGLRADRFSLALEARALSSFAREVAPRGELSGALFGGGPVGCWWPGRFAGCLTTVVGAQRVGSAEISRPDSSTGLYWGIGARLMFQAPVSSSLRFTVAAEGLLNLSRNDVRLSNVEIWRAPPLGGLLQIGGEAHFL